MGLAHMDFLQSLMYTAIGLVVGGVATFFWTKRKFEKETNMYIDLEKQLKKEERRNQILLLIGFFIVLFIIGAIDEFIRHKFNKKN